MVTVVISGAGVLVQLERAKTPQAAMHNSAIKDLLIGFLPVIGAEHSFVSGQYAPILSSGQ
jgi:hypothetical protein